MIERLELIEKRYNEINELLMSPEVLSDIKKSKELSDFLNVRFIRRGITIILLQDTLKNTIFIKI